MPRRTTVFVIGFFTSLLLATQVAADPMVAFITSVIGTGDLSTWADANGATGIDAGDAVCQSRAAAAGLANPSHFVAWLSDSADDAYCRVHGLTGTKANNCGEAELPSWAGPWIRTDGYPFGGTIGQLTNGLVLTPLSVDENGTASTARTVFSGTNTDGTVLNASPPPCSDWFDSLAVSVGIGGATLTGNRWSANGTGTCYIAKPLYCLQVGAGDPLPSLPMNGALAFITSTFGTGRLQDWAEAGGFTGIDAGDAICQARAAAAGYDNPDQFKVWLSDDLENAAQRFSYDGPWIRPDGVPVASSLADLTDGNLFAPVSLRDDGYYESAEWAWTGTSGSGLSTALDCDHWTSDSDSLTGTRGFAIDAGEHWTDSWDQSCDYERSLYCFAQVPYPFIFIDGFESGTLDEWDL